MKLNNRYTNTNLEMIKQVSLSYLVGCTLQDTPLHLSGTLIDDNGEIKYLLIRVGVLNDMPKMVKVVPPKFFKVPDGLTKEVPIKFRTKYKVKGVEIFEAVIDRRNQVLRSLKQKMAQLA